MVKKKIQKTLKKIPGKTGRKAVEVNWAGVNEVLERGLRMPSVLKVTGFADRSTVEDKIRDKFNMTFSEYREIQMSTSENILLGRMWDLTLSIDPGVRLKAIAFLMTHVYNYSQKVQVNQVTATVSYEEYLASLDKNS